jgi:hypothetical protein
MSGDEAGVQHWICTRCPAAFFCKHDDLPIFEPPNQRDSGHRHEWVIRPAS